MYIIGIFEMLVLIIIIANFINIMIDSDAFEKWQKDFAEIWRNMSEEEKQKFINDWYHKYD